MKIVFDSSTLILLAKIGLLRLISENFECVITPEVMKESTRKKGAFDAEMIMQLINEKKLSIIKSKPRKSFEYEFRLGAGEASVMQFAKSENRIIAADDKAVIKACKILNIKFVTAIDFVIGAFENNKISVEEARTKIIKLDRYGRYDSQIIKSALKKIGDENE